MAALARKKYSGQTGERNTQQGDRQEEPYIVTDASSVTDAIAAALAAATAAGEDSIIADGVELFQTGVAWEFVAEAADGSAQAYEITIRYGLSSSTKRDVGSVRISYDTVGGTIHTEFARSEVVYPSGADAPSFDNLIGNNSTGAQLSIDGVDVPVPTFNLTITKVFSRADLPDPANIFWLTGKTNDAELTFTDSVTGEIFEFQEGELTFLGGRHPDPRADGAIEMTYSITASPNVTNKTVGGITGIDKQGSQYLWVRKEPTATGDNSSKLMALQVKAVVVNDVLESGNFALLGI